MPMRMLWIAAVATLLASCVPGEDVPLAEAKVAEFRQLLGEGRFAEIYAGASQELRTSSSEADLVRLLEGVRTNLGAFQSADAPAWTDNFNDNGRFLVLDYKSRYANGPANERFTWRIADGQALLAGYEIKTDGEIE